LSLAQGKVTQVKIMLMPSSLNQVKERLKEESNWQAQACSLALYLSLEYMSSYYQEGCNMVVLTKPKCSKSREISRVVKGNQIPKCDEISPTGQTDCAYRLDLFQIKSGTSDLPDSFTGFQRGFPDMSDP
jgi:hypothetical protein